MPSLAKSSSANSLSSQSSAAKSPPRTYDGIPPELLAAFECLCVLVEKETKARGVLLSYIPSFDAFLWEAYKVGHVGSRDAKEAREAKEARATPAVQHFLQILLGRVYAGADSFWTYYITVVVACIGYKYLGDLYGDTTTSWRHVRRYLRWFLKHAFPTHPSPLQETEAWIHRSVIPLLEKNPGTVIELLQEVKACIPALQSEVAKKIPA